MDGYQGFANCEISMYQNPSHSQMPEFTKNESNTKPVLYQHPPSSEQLAKSNKRAKVKAWSQDAFLVVVLLGTIGSVPFTVRSCSNDVDRQHAAALKYQLQFSASSNEGAR